MADLTEVYRNLGDRERDTIASIYMHRCLTLEQIFSLFYSANAKNDTYCKLKVDKMEKDGLIESVFTKSRKAYFLTNDGVEVAKHLLDIPQNIFDAETKRVKRGYFRASELKIIPRNINHQLMLNQFYIDFFLSIGKYIPFQYYDEKYITDFINIRPDGLIRAFDTDFFIETDMSTESQNQLYEKWDNYRRFLSSSEYKYKTRKIVVLFAIENTKFVENRIDMVKNTIYNRISDKIEESFEIYVDTRENLINIIKEQARLYQTAEKTDLDRAKELLEKAGFFFSSGSLIAPMIGDTLFSYYLRKYKPDKKGSLEIVGGTVQEFVIDSYHNKPYSVLRKVESLGQANIFYEKNMRKRKAGTGRTLKYIILCDNLYDIWHDLYITGMSYTKNIVATTLERLETMPLHEALVTISENGNVNHFLDMSLTKSKYEFNIPEESEN